MYAGKGIKRKQNPRENASFLNIIWFIYSWAVFKIGLKREVQEDDIFEVMKCMGSEKVTDKLEREWFQELKRRPKDPSLVLALLRTFGREYGLLGSVACVYRICWMVIRPISISKIVAYFVEGQTTITREDAYFYAILLLTTKSIYEIVRHQYSLLLDQVALKLKASLASIVYRKTLRINELTTNDVSAGHIMTIIAKDIDVFEIAAYFFHDIWIGLIELFIMTYMMYKAIGVSTFVGIGYLLVQFPIVFYVGKVTAKRRFVASARSDERLRIMQEIFATIKLIKIYTWDKYFTRLGVNARKKEMDTLRFLAILKSVVISLGFISSRFSFYLCMMFYIYTNNNLTSSMAYLILNCYDTIRWVLGISIPENVARIGEASSCVRRIKNFLLTSEIPVHKHEEESEKVLVQLKNVEVGVGDKVTILNNINLELRHGLIGITGPVGSGKSTLLKTILNDVLLRRGEVHSSGNMSYASQEPWIFPGTIRQNILFGQEFNEKRYNMTMRMCALERDVNNWPNGDNFLVIDRGLNISRGQQARVNLARTIYRDANIYLLDDSLSALDSLVSEHVFNTCIADHLSDKLVILVTHNTNFLAKCANILYMKGGTITHKGTYTELENLGVDFGDSLHNAAAKIIDNKETTYVCEKDEADSNNSSSESSKLLNNNSDNIQIYQEYQKEGKVDFSIYRFYFASMGGWTYLVPLAMVFIACEASGAYWDYFISDWVDLEQNRTNYIDRNLTHTEEYHAMEPVYDHWRKLCTVFIAIATVLNVVVSCSYFTLSTRASRKIHNMSFKKIMGATMEFFDQNLPGTVLNRFSKDFNVVDEQVPTYIFDIASIFIFLIGVSVNITLTNIMFIIPTLCFAALLYFSRAYYLRTGRSLHRLNGITRAPVIGHLNATLNGLTTIRSTGNQDILKKQFDRHQDVHTSVYYMHLYTITAFQFYMDFLCGIYIAIIIFTFLNLETATMAGKVGLGISQSFLMTGILQWGIRQSSKLEIRMTSCERILEYTELKQEETSGKVPLNWPTHGKLEYSNVSMCYTNSEEPVLKDISFVVQPKEKIGIIGRTGAGKSSILSALFRLYKTSGKMTIDDVDITEIELNEARSKISIIPQDPVLFSGTLRSNLDPYNLYTDAQLWGVLKEVNLGASLGVSLDTAIQHGGSNFSIGERQLICLARAILRNNRLLVLDEATANVDPHTDALMQQTIARAFKDCTMLIIAHRLNTVMNCDKVMVVDGGSVVEFGSPEALMENKSGIFCNLVKSSGMHIKAE